MKRSPLLLALSLDPRAAPAAAPRSTPWARCASRPRSARVARRASRASCRASCASTAWTCGSCPMREYNEDPVFWSIVSPTTMAARRRTIYVFCDRGPERGVERDRDRRHRPRAGCTAWCATRWPPMGTAGATRRAPSLGPEQWKLLAPVVEECDPADRRGRLHDARLLRRPLARASGSSCASALPARYRGARGAAATSSRCSYMEDPPPRDDAHATSGCRRSCTTSSRRPSRRG